MMMVTDGDLVEMSPEDIKNWEVRLRTCGRRIVLLLYAGSHMYHTNTVDSDVDVRGVVMPLEEEVLGLARFDMLERKHGDDCVLYSLHKYVKLLMKGNPNVHEWLWAEDYEMADRIGMSLIVHRKRFISMNLAKQCFGYINGQLTRMTRRRSWRDLGAKRKALVQKYGYDTKNAAHAVRIARQTTSLFRTGVMEVVRKHDRDELLRIRNGALSVEDAQRLIKEELARAEAAAEKNPMGFPAKPDWEFANKWIITIMKENTLRSGSTSEWTT